VSKYKDKNVVFLSSHIYLWGFYFLVEMSFTVDPRKTLKSIEDRYCGECGNVVFGMAREKRKICPHRLCKAVVPLTEGWDEESGYGRCGQCFSLLHSKLMQLFIANFIFLHHSVIIIFVFLL
jgi:hypothetical protein